ncbi:PrsW family intramembrane metalloprotease [Actinomadura rupiterrae]|uniref:PrsW family intramembrane metalloprotease n=1 Tax=Actinomadura rupiterrae TaxID=559627 RepID=UPI0020A33DFB|nr:PrsW family intramembrane metalloprotease [Actinomadura rupiterrae]MCP2340637.1 RsiW-degrading membrane proteinase PrsW (M82 family) [Actinomadura rupiterrae]
MVVTGITANSNLVPTIVLLGSFAVPMAFVVWAYEHGTSGEITVPYLFRAFVVGGVLGLLGASLLETYLLHPSPWMYVGVGLIEEAAKLAALMYVAHRLHVRTTRDGLVLGATVGFGFAAFESAGYAANALFTVHGLSIRAMVETEILRGLLSPVGHGLWTAIVGGVLFSASRRRQRLHISGAVILTWLGVSLLHALWDSMHGIAIAVTLRLTGDAWQAGMIDRGYLPEATPEQGHLIALLDWAGLIAISAIGLTWLRTLSLRASSDDSEDEPSNENGRPAIHPYPTPGVISQAPRDPDTGRTPEPFSDT